MDRRPILLTGAAGAIGREVAHELARGGLGVVALLHRAREPQLVSGRTLRFDGPAPPLPGPGELRHVSGDVTDPALGLPAGLRRELRAAVGAVVHCAAITEFGLPPQRYERVNVEGTRHVLDFVASGPAPAPALVHVSTAYVAGARDAHVREDELEAGQRFGNPYEETKHRAERLVRDAGVPVAIVRPSIVVGTQRNGTTRDFKTIYALLRLITQGRVRTLPGHYGALLDLVPVDYVRDVVVEAVRRFDEARGLTLHAVNGTPITLRDVSDVLAEYPPFHVPRFVPPQSFDPDALSPLERRFYDGVVSLYASYFARRLSFANDAAAAFVPRRPPASAKPLLRRQLDYCLRIGYLGPRRPLPPALARLEAQGAARPDPSAARA